MCCSRNEEGDKRLARVVFIPASDGFLKVYLPVEMHVDMCKTEGAGVQFFPQFYIVATGKGLKVYHLHTTTAGTMSKVVAIKVMECDFSEMPGELWIMECVRVDDDDHEIEYHLAIRHNEYYIPFDGTPPEKCGDDENDRKMSDATPPDMIVEAVARLFTYNAELESTQPGRILENDDDPLEAAMKLVIMPKIGDSLRICPPPALHITCVQKARSLCDNVKKTGTACPLGAAATAGRGYCPRLPECDLGSLAQILQFIAEIHSWNIQ